ncbi:carboxymuconolactone decarboxylase family protein [Stappia sp.]|uniref:carboxymuconolactone decarboxylase family protein n=1 Tax=Stappia sp. TaxID=1870903 RepID=UPI0032D8E3FB
MLTMSPVTLDTADAIATPILQSIKDRYGMVPNFFGALGIDGAAMRGYLAFEESLEDACHLSTREREFIALAVANANGCHYCVSGHTFSARRAGMSAEDCAAAQRGEAEDASEQAVLTLALRAMETRGNLEPRDFEAAGAAGIPQEKLIQICAWVALNTFSNWINNIVQPKIDFPKVPLQGPCEAAGR